MRKIFFLSFVFLSTFFVDALAQSITVTAKLDSTVLKIGDQACLSFEVTQQPKQKVFMPIFSDTIVGGLELVERMKNDSSLSADGLLVVKQRYLVTSFEDSLLYIPPFPFVINGDTVWSKSLSLKVVQPFEIDTAASSITDIKPVFTTKYDWVGLIKTILLVLLVIALLVVLYFVVRKYVFKKTIFEPKADVPVLPPHVLALAALDKLKQEKAWQQGRSKEYHTELTDVIREYVERMFSIPAMEMTTDEILEQLSFMRFDQKTAYAELKQMLQLADLVKFAKWDGTPDEHELSLTNAYSFVNSTKIEDTKPLDEPKNEEQKVTKVGN